MILTSRIGAEPKELCNVKLGWIFRFLKTRVADCLEPGNVAALSTALHTALETDVATLADMARQGRTRVETRHDQARNAEELRGHISKVSSD